MGSFIDVSEECIDLNEIWFKEKLIKKGTFGLTNALLTKDGSFDSKFLTIGTRL